MDLINCLSFIVQNSRFVFNFYFPTPKWKLLFPWTRAKVPEWFLRPKVSTYTVIWKGRHVRSFDNDTLCLKRSIPLRVIKFIHLHPKFTIRNTFLLLVSGFYHSSRLTLDSTIPRTVYYPFPGTPLLKR